MQSERRSPAATFLKWTVFLTGWAVAIGLGLKCWRPAPPPPSASTCVIAPIPKGSPPATAISRHPLDEAFRDWSSDPALDGVLIGFCLLDDQGQTLFASPLAASVMCPASALKTVTTGAALELLGPEFRFETKVLAASDIDANGVLNGNLILRGSGDPTLDIADLDSLADDLIRRGLKQVKGALRADASIFPATVVNDHWNWGDIGNAYGAGTFGINLEHNRVIFRFDGGAREGDVATLLDSTPALPGVAFQSSVTSGPADSGDQVMVYSQPYGRGIALSGKVPAGAKGFEVTGAIPNPPALAENRLRSRLEQAGVKFQPTRPASPAAAQVELASHRSAALPEIIDHLHRVSDNLEAQSLFLTIGNAKRQAPEAALRSYWEDQGITTKHWRLIDGSGLARANMIRPLDLARINHAARKAATGDRFLQSLSQYDNGGTRSKLGAMSGVKTEVGFITLADGREATFCLMANGLTPGRGDFWKRRTQWLELVRQQRSTP